MNDHVNYTLTVAGTRKPARVVPMHTARVRVTGAAPVFEIIRAGLGALHLPTYSVTATVRNDSGEVLGPDDVAYDETVTVEAYE